MGEPKKPKATKQYMVLEQQDHGDGNGPTTYVHKFDEQEPAFEYMVDAITNGNGNAVELFEIKPIKLKLGAKRA